MRCNLAAVSSSCLAVRFLLIPVHDALPAVEAHFERWPHDEAPSEAELRELVEVTAWFVAASDVLLRYAKVLGGRPSRS